MKYILSIPAVLYAALLLSLLSFSMLYADLVFVKKELTGAETTLSWYQSALNRANEREGKLKELWEQHIEDYHPALAKKYREEKQNDR